MTDKPLPNAIDLTPLNPDFNDNPHVFLDRLRNECPVRRDERAGKFILTRYEDIRRIVSDRTMWRSPGRAEKAAVFQQKLTQRLNGNECIPEDERNSSILLLDDPDHSRIRTPLAKALYKRVAQCRPLVEDVVNGKLDALDGRHEFDAVSGFARLVPIDTIARILGVARSRLLEFREWSEGAILELNPFRTQAQTERLIASVVALSGCFRELMAERRKEPKDDLITDMVMRQAEGAPVTDGELVNNFQGLLIAGNLTTTDLIGNAVWLFLTHPDQLAKLKADPGLINNAVEEALRYESPVDITSRVAPRDMEINGCPVKTTQSLLMMLRAANRDPKIFPDPHRFDITRKDAPHVAFGGGAHLCIGSPLARLVAQTAISSFFNRFPNARLADPDAKPQWRKLPFFRGLETLMVRVQ